MARRALREFLLINNSKYNLRVFVAYVIQRFQNQTNYIIKTNQPKQSDSTKNTFLLDLT